MQATYQVNQTIWAKINGYPWWPAYVNSAADDKFEVVFFGDFSRAILHVSKLKDFGEIRHKVDGKNKTLDHAFRSVERVMSGESTIMEEWQKCNKAVTPKRKLSKRKSIKKGEKEDATENADDVSVCLSQRSKTKYQNFLSKMEADAKLELKRYHSVNNKITTSSYNHFIENQLFSDDILVIEEQLEGLWMALRNDEFDAELSFELLKEVHSKILLCDPKSVFKSSVGSLLTSCANVCRLKATEAGHRKVLDLLKPTVRDICEFIIKEGFLMENKVIDDYIDGSKRNSILNVFNLDIASAGRPDNNLNQMEKRATPEDSMFKVDEEEETRNPSQVVEVDERVQFRVKKKLAKVMYMNGAKGKLNKKSCEELATKVEKLVRKNAKGLGQYKERVVGLVKNLEKSSQAVCGLMQKSKRERGTSGLEEEVNNLSNN